MLSDPLAGETVAYLAFEDDRGEVKKMAALKPGPSPDASTSMLARPVDPEVTVRRHFDPPTLSNADPEEPETIARPFLAEVDADPTTLTKAVRELETLPREKKPIASDGATDNTAATLVRRDSIPPPPSMSSQTDITPIIRSGAVPWVESMPPVDPTPPHEPAIRTPLVMITAPEDNLTRVAPLAVPPPRRTPIPYPQTPTAGKVPVLRIAFAAGSIVLVVLLAVVAMRPRSHAAAASHAADEPALPAATALEAPPAVAHLAAGPPVAAASIASLPPAASMAASTTSPPAATSAASPPAAASATVNRTVTAPARAPTVRPEPRRRAPATRHGRANARPSVPVRRED